MAEEASAISAAVGADLGLVGFTNSFGWIVKKVDGFIKITSSPVSPSPRFDFTLARLPLCSLWRRVKLARVGLPTIFVRTGFGKTARSWSALRGILRRMQKEEKFN